MIRPLVTALITNHNYAEFVAAAVRSALEQTYSPVEVVVVDDGSTDGSRDVIKSFGDSVRTVFQENGGQAKAFQAGIAAARGDLVCLLDADDVWLPTKVERVVTDGWPLDAVLIYHRIQRVDGALKPWGRAYPRATRFPDLGRRAGRSGGWWVAPPTSALSCRTSYLEQIMPFPDAYRICADAYVTGLAPHLGRVHGIKETLALVRRHGGNNWRGDIDRDSELKRRAAMYELTVEELNRSLARFDVPVSVHLEDHWPHRAVTAELTGALTRRDAAIGLRFPAERNPLRRARDVARVARVVARQRRTRS